MHGSCGAVSSLGLWANSRFAAMGYLKWPAQCCCKSQNTSAPSSNGASNGTTRTHSRRWTTSSRTVIMLCFLPAFTAGTSDCSGRGHSTHHPGLHGRYLMSPVPHRITSPSSSISLSSRACFEIRPGNPCSNFYKEYSAQASGKPSDTHILPHCQTMQRRQPEQSSNGPSRRINSRTSTKLGLPVVSPFFFSKGKAASFPP